MQSLKNKVKELNSSRQRNALRCLQVVNKYEKLLGIRVKDTVFKFWDRLRKEGITNQSNLHISSTDQEMLPNTGILSPTFNGAGGASMLHDHSCSLSSISNINNTSFLEDSSITSVLYLRAKAVYKIKKIFNQRKLKPAFDAYMVKVFHANYRKSLFNLEGRRLMKIHSLLSHSIRRLNERVFSAFY